MAESPQEKKTGGRSASLVEEDEHEIEEAEKQSEGSGGIHDDLIDAVARGTEDPEVLREQDRFLPICNIARIMRRMVPESGKMSKESKEAIQEAVSEFISFITSEASDKCIEEQRKTITCDDLLNAFEVMGFEKYVEPLKLFMTRYRDATRADRPSGEGGDIRTPSPPLSTPLSIPIPAPFPHSASGPGGPIQPAPSHSLPSSTGLLSTAAGPMRISLPPGFVLGEKGSILYKGPAKAANVYQPSQQVVALEGVSMGGDGEGMEEGANGQPHGNSPFLPTTSQGPSSSSEGPITIFVDQSTGQKYRSVIGQDGTQRLTPIRGANQNIKMIRRGAPPPSNRAMDSPQPGPSSSLVDHHQSSQISSTTPHSTHSHYHAHSSYSQSVQSHQSHPPTQYHNTTNHPLPYHGSSSSTSHSSLPAPPPSSSSTNYIQLMPHSGVSSTYPPTTTPHQQYTQYQDQPLMSDGTNVGREEKRPMTSSIANAKWNPSSGQYVVDAPKIGGELSAKRRRVNNKEQ